MTKRHILCYLHSFEPGGVERTALNLCADWRARGAEVTVVMGRASGRARACAPDLDYVFLPRPGFSTARFETLWMLLWLPLLVLRRRPDVIFCAGNSYSIVAVLLRLVLGAACPPIVAKISNDLARPDMIWPVRRLYHLWCRIQGRLLTRLVALSPEMAAEVARVMRLSPDRVDILPDAVLLGEYRRALARAGATARAGRTGGRRFLAIGRLARQKNFAALIAAFAQGARAEDCLTIVGDGPERARLARQIQRLGLEQRVRLAGHARRVTGWIGQADALLLSSRYEGLPAVVIEALAAGLPVIASDCCASMASMIGHGRFGRLVPADCEASLAAAIAAPLPPIDSAAAARHAGAHCSRAVADQYLALFSHVVPARAPAAAHPRPLAEA
ncbi:glycosyltransferase [Sphingomonas morindae]|uniref:Glycosyltransferase n=1 Tax=Sphingomonas morindae TaxID=1541170 RepID=A0ABY4X915_9SPHN|nr:glycosyltransferase [Sphingomonas morindae]USI73412.1 glycosyltransferase [Sphingomonas morindae]